MPFKSMKERLIRTKKSFLKYKFCGIFVDESGYINYN